MEAVCLKAMATQPADRYATGRALADDIERWAAARARIGFLLDLAGDLSAARAAHEAAMADRRALAVAHPDGIKEAVGLASGLHFYGHFQQATGRMSKALASFREGRAINEIGHVLRVTGKPAEALTRERPQFQLHLPRLGPGPCGATRRGRRRPAPGHRTVAPGSRYEIRNGPRR